MDEDGEGGHVKEVYAHFGLAIYLAQVLEHGLVLAFVYLDLIPMSVGKVKTAAEWGERVDAFMDRHFESTLGALIKTLGEVADVPGDLEALLKRALTKRNWLAHDYFRERAEAFLSESGRNRMLKELEEAQELFTAADRRLSEVVKPMQHRFGITEERLHAVFEEMLQRAQSAG